LLTGEREIIRYVAGPFLSGFVLVAASERGVCAVLPCDAAEAGLCELAHAFPAAGLVDGLDGAELRGWLERIEAFADKPEGVSGIPLDIRGGAFARRVWKALRGIEPGRTASYVDVARRLGNPRAARAVAGACAANVLALLVPCHRVVRADGGTGGYRWGDWRKRMLLDAEKREKSKFSRRDT
jgi:AraC family transcriptional regulator of adaptative response/methylated-DNA-[protein]-cysteine methyltransferase